MIRELGENWQNTTLFELRSESKVEKSANYFKNGFNCAQAVLATFQQILFAHFDKRLARLLLSIYEKTGERTIKMMQEAMAQEVNSAREVVARMLKTFAGEGWIEINRGERFFLVPVFCQQKQIYLHGVKLEIKL